MDDTVRRLVTLCDLFAEGTGLSVSTVSRHATGSGDTIARLRRGAAITTRRAERAFRFLAQNWPEPVEWPADIPRPAMMEYRPARQRTGSSSSGPTRPGRR